jgi:hypothetical protein
VTEHEDHERVADQLEHESDQLQRRSDELGEKISDVRDDWQRKRADPAVPGAPPPEGQSDAEDDAGES